MNAKSIRTAAIVLISISNVAAPVGAAENTGTASARVLVTFENASAGKSIAPGHSYRYRPRYRISQIALSNAEAVATDYGLMAIDDWPIESLKVYCVVYQSRDSKPLAELIALLDGDPRVESAQAMHRFHAVTSQTTGYNDFYAGFQHGLRSMDVLQAHQFALGNGVKVAVVDTGIDRNHEDLSGSEIQVRNFISDDRSFLTTEHGTAVVSVIGANSNNQKGIVGVAPAAELTALSACWSENEVESAYCDSFTLAKAMDFLIESPPDLVNLSFAGPRDNLLGRLIEAALQNGIIIVAAMPKSSQRTNVYPASYPGVIAIGSAPTAKEKTSVQSNAVVGLFAPGEQIMVALPDDLYDFRSGSSLATANASGVIALLLEHAPNLDSEQIAEILKTSQTKNKSGGAVINACRALAEIGVAGACL